MPLRRATAIIHPAIHVIWMGDSPALLPHSSLQLVHISKKAQPILFGKISHPDRFFYFKKYGLLQIEWVKWGGFSRVDGDFKGFLVNLTVTSWRHVCPHAKIDQDEAPER
jgi:hypothetical protein